MKKSRLLLLSCFGLVLFTTAPSLQAQYFKFDNASDQQEVESEVEAILKFFSSVVGGGQFHTADLHSFAGLDVGARAVVARVPEKFDELPVFSEEKYVGLGFLHGSLGLPGPFEVVGRFFYLPIGSSADTDAFPVRSLDSRGGVTLIGGGLKYGLLQMPGVPKVMVMGMYHALFVPEEFDFGTVRTLSLNAVASHSIPLLSVYAGVGIDITTLELNESFSGGSFSELEGKRFTENLPHLTVGAKFTILPLVHVNASYNISEFSSVDVGLGISFR